MPVRTTAPARTRARADRCRSRSRWARRRPVAAPPGTPARPPTPGRRRRCRRASGEQQAFGQELPEPCRAAARADRQPDGELPPACGGFWTGTDSRCSRTQSRARRHDAAEQQGNGPHLLRAGWDPPDLPGRAETIGAAVRRRGFAARRTWSSQPPRSRPAPARALTPGRRRPSRESQPAFGFLRRSGFCSPE